MPALSKAGNKRKTPRKSLGNNKEEDEKRVKISHRSHKTEPGVVLSVGNGDVGQLGLGPDIMEKTRPGLVNLEEEIVQVCAGGMHTVCLSVSGKVYTFGCNDENALGRDTSEEGTETYPGLVELPEKIVQVSAGDSNTAALSERGKVFVWGNFRDASGSIGLTTAGPQKTPLEYLPDEVFIKVASGGDHLMLLTIDGNIYTAGCAEQGQLGRIAGIFTDRGGRKGLDLILKPDVVRCKINKKNQPKFTDIWTGQYTSYAKDSDGNIHAWGLNNYYQLGFPDMVDRFIPEKSESFTSCDEWLDIVGGQHHTVALGSDNKVYTFGRSEYGRLGLGEDAQETKTPTLVDALKDEKIVAIGGGASVSYAINSEGVLYAWGMGTSYQLASGNDDDAWVPIKMGGKQLAERKGLSLSAGGQHVVLLCKSAS